MSCLLLFEAGCATLIGVVLNEIGDVAAAVPNATPHPNKGQVYPTMQTPARECCGLDA
jgi:hypothetical protein